jgi:pentose-5-phosphate-3-epimerase
LAAAVPVEQEVQVQNFRVLTVLTPYFLQSPPRAVAVVENHQATEPTAALAVAVAEARAALLAAPATLQAFLRHKEATAEMGLALRPQTPPQAVAAVVARQQLVQTLVQA